MRSATTVKSAACIRETPSIVMVLVPAPLTLAPIAFKKSARSTISGSCAAFSITLIPLANTAAIIAFSVPVTVTMSIKIRAPTSFFAVARMKPFSTCTSAPSACMALMCKFTGRAPIAQPPGKDTSAWPYLASSGPSTKIDARMVLTNSYGATVLCTPRGSAINEASSPSTNFTPICPSSAMVVVTSCRCGTLRIVTGSSGKSAAQSIGNTAFFAPEICTLPLSGTPPVMLILNGIVLGLRRSKRFQR